MGVTVGMRTGLAAAVFAAALASPMAAAETNMKFTLDTKFEGPSAPFLLALDKGYYKAEGLSVSIDAIDSALETVKRVVAGDSDLAVVDINALIVARANNPDASIKAVFMVYNRPPFAVIGRKSRGINRPKDLEGKRLGAPAADGAFALWPVFVQANNIDAAKVTIENVSAPVRVPMLAAGEVDAITGTSFSSFVNLKERGVPANDIVVLLMADYGVDLYGSAIVVNPKFAAEHPDAVKGFLRALLKGLKDTVKSPATAVDAVLKRNGEAKKEIELERLRMAIRDNIATAEVRQRGYGDIDAARFAKAIDQIALAYRLKAKPKPEDLFDASFLPSPAERKF